MQIEVKRSARRSMSMEMRPDGTLLIRAPLRAPARHIDRFIKDHTSWIQKRREAHAANPLAGTPTAIYLLGQLYNIEHHHAGRFKYVLSDNCLSIYGPETKTIQDLLIQFYKKEANLYLPERLYELSDQVGYPVHDHRITSARTRWGSCGRDHNIALTWRLMSHDPDTIDYVILHEIAHIKHPNHGKRFWQLVLDWDSTAHKHRRALKDLKYQIPF
jgi:predicted metal-dependent hydrolase